MCSFSCSKAYSFSFLEAQPLLQCAMSHADDVRPDGAAPPNAAPTVEPETPAPGPLEGSPDSPSLKNKIDFLDVFISESERISEFVMHEQIDIV